MLIEEKVEEQFMLRGIMKAKYESYASNNMEEVAHIETELAKNAFHVSRLKVALEKNLRIVGYINKMLNPAIIIKYGNYIFGVF